MSLGKLLTSEEYPSVLFGELPLIGDLFFIFSYAFLDSLTGDLVGDLPFVYAFNTTLRTGEGY